MDSATRQTKLQGHKRQQIKEAAARLFSDQGLKALTMRAIATEAGYSLGAAYRYYASKEAIYEDLLADSLADLSRALRLATPSRGGGRVVIRTAFSSFYRFFRERPRDRQLVLALFGGPADRSELPENKLLDSRLIAALGFLANTLHHHSSLSAAEAQSETVAAVTYLSGVLLLSATGRLSLLGQSEEEMVDRYMEQMLKRAEQ